VESVGIADRACFDLKAHSEAKKQTKTELTAFIEFKDGPRNEETIELTQNKQAIGKTFKGKAAAVNAYLDSLDEQKREELRKSLEKGPVKVRSVQMTSKSPLTWLPCRRCRSV